MHPHIAHSTAGRTILVIVAVILLGLGTVAPVIWAGSGGTTSLWSSAADKQEATQPTYDGADPDAVFEAFAEQMTRAATVGREVLNRLPRDRWNVTAAVDLTDGSPAGVHSFVRDETRWIPYRGALRGPIGVLQDRTANHLDRALLTAAMMRVVRTDAEIRIGHATLSDDAVAALWADMIERAAAEDAAETEGSAAEQQEETDAQIQEALGLYASLMEVDPAELRAATAEQELNGQRRLEDAHAQAWPIIEDLAARLEIELTEPDAEADDALPAPMAAQLADYWWVEYRESSDQPWQPVDPAAEALGETRADRAADSVEFFTPDAVPAEWFHSLRIQVDAEKRSEDGLEYATAVEHELRLADLGSQPVIQIGLEPLGWPSDVEPFASEDQQENLEAVLDACRKTEEWLPYIKSASENVYDNGIRRDGTLNSNPDPGMVGRALGEATDLLRGMGGSDDGPATSLTGVRVRFTLTDAAGDAVVIDRPLIDLLGPAARTHEVPAFEESDDTVVNRAIQAFGYMALLPQTSWHHPAYAAGYGIFSLVQSRSAIIALMKSAAEGERTQFDNLLGQVRPSHWNLHTLAANRRAWSPIAGDAIVAEANLLASFREVSLIDNDGEVALRSREGFDILHNPVARDPRSPLGEREVRLCQGVADTVTESALITAANQIADRADGDELSNSAMHYLGAIADGSAAGWQSLAGPDSLTDERVAQLNLSDDIATRIRAELAAGQTLIVAPVTETTPPVWWRIHPATGTILGASGPYGRGQAMAEEITNLINNAFSVLMTLMGVMDCAASLAPEEFVCCMRNWALTGAVGVGYGAALGMAGASALAGLAINVFMTGVFTFGPSAAGSDPCAYQKSDATKGDASRRSCCGGRW